MSDADRVASPEQPPSLPASGRSRRVDKVLRWLVVLGVAAVLGMVGLFGYEVWQTRHTEDLSTPTGRAIADLRKQIKAKPNDAALRVRIGEALASAGLLDDAVEQLRTAVKLDPKHTGAYLDLGIVALQTDQSKTAEGYFNKVIDLTQNSDMENINKRRELAFFHLGEIALDARRYEDAAANFKAALRIRRDASDTYYLLAQAYKGMDRPDAALEQLEAALAFDPSYAEAHYLMGELYLERGDKINAAVHFRMAAERAPEQDLPKEALSSLGTAAEAIARGRDYLADGSNEKAIEEGLLARALDPDSLNAALFHGEVSRASGETSAALDAYQAAIKLDPANAVAKAALAELNSKK